MRILDWEVTINHDGSVRCAQHPENGNVTWINGRLVGHCDVPPEVFAWLIRPQLRRSWDMGCITALRAPTGALWGNPYIGEPPNKDKEPS